MSRGLGHIERAIITFFDDTEWCAERWTAESLAIDVYRTKEKRPTRAQRVAVLRAMHSLARKYPDRFVLTGGKGRGPLWLGRKRGQQAKRRK
jgi:hypothetical protein